MSNPNLQSNLKDDWFKNNVVMPDDVNQWTQNINNLNDMIPVYASTGCFYSASFQDNVYNLTPLTFEDDSQNITLNSYEDGMVVEFKIPESNTGECSVNVNNLGNKFIKNLDNSTLTPETLCKGQYIKLRYNKEQGYFNIDTGSSVNRDLSNLTETGEKHFLNKSQITNCILSAPNGVATYSGNTITLKAGLKVLLSNGRNADKTLNNIEFIFSADETAEISSSGDIFVIQDSSIVPENIHFLRAVNYFEQEETPTSTETGLMIWRKPTENQFYYYWTNGGITTWTKLVCGKVAKVVVTDSAITSLTPYQPVELAKQQDLDGQIEFNNYNFIDGIIINSGTNKNFSLSSILPNDGNLYEMLVECYGSSTTSKSGDGVFIYAKTSSMGTICFGRNRTWENKVCYVGSTSPMYAKADDVLTISLSDASGVTNPVQIDAYIRAIRKVR